MADKHRGRPETVGFTLSAAVPVEAVGFILKAMFDHGCPPNSLDLKAIVGSVNGNGPTHLLEPAAFPALPRGRGRQAANSNVVAADIRKAILSIMSGLFPEPAQRKSLFAAVRVELKEEISEPRISTAVADFMRGKIIASDGAGLYTLTKTGQRIAASVETEPELGPPAPETEPAPSPPGITPGSGQELIIQTMRVEPLRRWTIEEMREVFVAAGRAPGSAKDTLQKVFQRGLIKRPGPGTYQFATGA